MKEGWIKLYRSSFENKLYFEEPFTRYQAWIDLLLLANHKDGYFMKRGTLVKVPRGTVGYSMKELAKRWKWSINKVSRYIEILESETVNQVKSQKNNVTTLISIVNYERYQSNESANELTNGNQANSQTETNKNAKECKEENNIKNIPHFQKINNIQNEGGLMPPPNSPAFSLPDKIFTANDFNELPNQNVVSLKNFLEVSKQVIVTEEEIQKLWEVFKVQELTGEKPYLNKEGVYRHFLNWSKRQSYAKTGRSKNLTKKRESILKPFAGEIKGLKFSEDFTLCEMEDGTLVKLTANQKALAESNLLSPQNVKKTAD